MKTEIDLEYQVKCRRCGKHTMMWFGNTNSTTKENFKTWVYEHATFPIHKQCSCDNGMMMLHDIVAYTLHAVLP